MKFRIFVIFVIILTHEFSCTPSQPQLAVKKLVFAEELLAKGDTANCLLHLDSISVLYPEAYSEGRTALQISNRIYISQLMKQRVNLTGLNLMIDSVMKEFSPQKGEFDRYTSYINKLNIIDNSRYRSFVQAYLNEKGDLTLVSNYYGSQWLNHTSLKVESDGVVVKTDSVPLNHVDNFHSDFNGSKWEKVTYRGNFAEAVIGLIASNADKKLKCVFQGKTSYPIWLEEADKKAIMAAYNLAGILKIKTALEKNVSALEKKIKSEEQ